jgi:putative membrane protein
MRTHPTALIVALSFLMLGFASACQRQNPGVEAAREDRSAASSAVKDVLSTDEQELGEKIEQAHLGEIDLGRLAKQRASNKDVKSYADMVVADHTSALDKLSDLMKEKNVTNVQQKSPDAEAALSKLQNLSGADFDRLFMDIMIQDHQKAIDMLHSKINSVQNPDLKNYINDILPKMEKHIQEAQRLQPKLTTSNPQNKTVSQ